MYDFIDEKQKSIPISLNQTNYFDLIMKKESFPSVQTELLQLSTILSQLSSR